MLSAVAFSSVFEHYLGDDMKRQSPPAEDSSDEDDRKNAGNLYDKVSSHQKASIPIFFFMFRKIFSLHTQYTINNSHGLQTNGKT